MAENEELAAQFETHRTHLQAVAYRMLGSLSEADDAVQEGWLHLSRAGATEVTNLGGWLTTVVARICLDMLRTRKSRREEPEDTRLPDPIVTPEEASGPEGEVLLADSVGLALLVVLETLAPAERLAFVLHDLFGLGFDEIAPLVGRTPAAARQLASRARRRVQGGAPAAPAADRAHHREVVNAFLAASRGGDLDGLLAVLDPDVVLRSDSGPGTFKQFQGARTVAGRSLMFSRLASPALVGRPVLVNGSAGILNLQDGRPTALLGFTIRGAKIVELNILSDPARLAGLELGAI